MSAATDTPAQLDERQRAMLQAMGITLWQPEFYLSKQPIAQQNTAQEAIKSGALNSPNAAARPASAVQTPGAAPTPRPPMAVAAQATAQPLNPSFTSSLTPSITPSLTQPSTAASASSMVLQPLPSGIDSMDWAQLQTAVSTCQACALCAGRSHSVFGMGQASADPALAPRADWLIVGEAPTEQEDSQGEPFVGEAGQLLDNMLRAMKLGGQPLTRCSNVFISNVLKCRPPANRNPSAEEVAMCQPYLLRQIALLQPKIILAMGRFAVQALTGSTEPLGKLRGRVHALHGSSYAVPVIVTYHPAYLLRNLPDKAKAWADLLLAMETLENAN